MLPRAQRRAIELAYFGGLTQVDIAALTRAPLGTVKSRVRLGLLKLREVLEGPMGQGDEGTADQRGVASITTAAGPGARPGQAVSIPTISGSSLDWATPPARSSVTAIPSMSSVGRSPVTTMSPSRSTRTRPAEAAAVPFRNQAW